MTDLLITIELTPKTASMIHLMDKARVFLMDTGLVTLNFKKGILTTVKTEQFTYAPLQNKENVYNESHEENNHRTLSGNVSASVVGIRSDN